MNAELVSVLKTLPPIVAAIVWDVVNNNVTPATFALAREASEQEYRSYGVVRIIADGNPAYAQVVGKLASVIVDEMLEKQVAP